MGYHASHLAYKEIIIILHPNNKRKVELTKKSQQSLDKSEK
jgi:hypothetical protein